MNELLEMSMRSYTDSEYTRKFQELSYFTLLGYNVCGLNGDIFFCLRKDYDKKLIFAPITDTERGMTRPSKDASVYHTNPFKIISDKQIIIEEANFFSLISDKLGKYDDLSRKDFLNSIKRYIKEYFVATNEYGKTLTKDNEFKVNERAYYARYCAIKYALSHINDRLCDEIIKHGNFEMENVCNKDISIQKYTSEAYKNLSIIEPLTSEIDLIRERNWQLNFHCRYIDYNSEMLLNNVLDNLISEKDSEQREEN